MPLSLLYRVQKKGLKPLSTVFQRLSAFSPLVSPIAVAKESCITMVEFCIDNNLMHL